MPAKRSPGNRGTILVAEDNEANALLIARQLARLGYEATVVADGAEALAAIERGRYALVLMDCQMPGVDGFEATRAIREAEAGTGRRLPVVAVTASATERDREACFEAGMDDFVTKPVLLEALAAVVDRWVRGAEAAALAPSPPSTSPVERAGREAILDGSVLARMRDEIGDEAASRFVATYLAELPGRLAAIREAAAEGEAEGLRSAAHALKSPSAGVGAHRLAAACRDLEELGAAGRLADARTRAEELDVLGRETVRALGEGAREGR